VSLKRSVCLSHCGWYAEVVFFDIFNNLKISCASSELKLLAQLVRILAGVLLPSNITQLMSASAMALVVISAIGIAITHLDK
jgi:hypothetical protein